MKKILIIGGTSGLGLALARLFATKDSSVFITGRSNPGEKGVHCINLDISPDTDKLSADLDNLVEKTVPIDLLIYSAGFSQIGSINKLGDSEIRTMNNVGLQAPQMLLQRILRKQSKLDGFIVITSTSQWIPRFNEPVYASAKAGLAHFAHSVSFDPQVEKTLVVGPSGMDTAMRTGRNDTGALLDTDWVAKEIASLYEDDFEYKLARILRDPPRVEEMEKR